MDIRIVARRCSRAEEQLSRYRATLEAAYGETPRLRTHPVVALGLERLVW